MVFSSFTFLFLFFPLVILIYYISKNRTYRNIILLLFSLAFYAWGEPKNILLMLFSIIANYFIAILIEKREKKRKLFLVIGVIINVSAIFLFKYLNFSISIVNSLFNTSINDSNILLPIGISFYTFQILSYIIDVYRKNVKAQKSIYKLALYISLFPQLIAGPIVRYVDVEKQIEDRKESLDSVVKGLSRFIIGLAKKVIIANNMAIICDTIYSSDISQAGTVALWVAAITYALQIYFDFSGYSDMAIGIGKVFGFDFLENFNYPYVSLSITEFWRRWHISLSGWFKDYVYIPLGGSRVSRTKCIRNILIVWMLTGLWHGSNYNYIIWGLYYGILLIIEKYVLKGLFDKVPKLLKWFITSFIVIIGWVIFRIESLSQMLDIFKNMFKFDGVNVVRYFANSYEILMSLIYLPLAIIFVFPIFKKIDNKYSSSKLYEIIKYAALLFILGLSTILLLKNTYNPFIYFKF